jgi:hypothetical protein
MAKKRAPKVKPRSIEDDLNDWVSQGEPGKIAWDMAERRYIRDMDALPSIDEAIEVLARVGGTVGMIEEGLDQMLKIQLSVLTKVHYVAVKKMAAWDDEIKGGSLEHIKRIGAEVFALLDQAQETYVRACKNYASIMHTLSIGGKKANPRKVTTSSPIADVDPSTQEPSPAPTGNAPSLTAGPTPTAEPAKEPDACQVPETSVQAKDETGNDPALNDGIQASCTPTPRLVA